MKLKKKWILVPFALFLLFYSYRVYFWGDIEKYGLQEGINAIGDTAISWFCGYLLYRFNDRYAVFKRFFHLPSLLIIILASFALYTYHLIVYMAFSRLDADFESWFNAVCFQLLDSVAMIITGALVHIIVRYHSDRLKLQANIEALTLARNQAELNFLKSRIDPHFIFNGLNNIYHEVEAGNEKARTRILQFSDIMRYHLHHAEKDKVDADTELKYTRSFVNFQFARMSDFLDLEQEFEVEDAKAEIEPFLLLPFLENAFKFCVPKNNLKGKIRLQLNFTSQLLDFKLSNTYDPQTMEKLKGNGFGLKNVIKRLKLVYGDKYELSIKDDKLSHVYYCHLKVLL
jgi:sensor histidine kinase YesM